jgi:hypothetical protein
MNSMSFYLWLLPVIFMIHEFEEIFMVEAWYEKYKEKIKTTWPKRMPFGLDYAGHLLSARIGLGIFAEFLVVILICILCALFDNYYAWWGFLAANVIHMLTLHLRDAIQFKGYTPGIITCAITFIPCIWILYQSAAIMQYGMLEVVLSAVVVYYLEGLFMFKFIHKAVASWGERLYQYSQAETAK